MIKRPRKTRSRIPRPDDDFYIEPAAATEALLRAIAIRGSAWDPACGSGVLAHCLMGRGLRVVPTDLNDQGFGMAGVDFLACEHRMARAIITNPPFSLYDEFVLKAIALQVELAAFLVPTRYLEGQARNRKIYSPHPPALVLQFADRMKFYSGHHPIEDQPGWDNEAFMWIIWRKRYGGGTELRWIAARPELELDITD